MTAEEHFKEWIDDPSGRLKLEYLTYRHKAVLDFADDYHKAKVEAIIKRVDIQIKLSHDLGTPKSEIQILKWLKEQLNK